MGEPSDRDEAGEGARKRVLAGWAHPASLAVRGTSPKAGGRGSACPREGFAWAVVPHPGTQATEMARGRRPRHRLRDGFQTAALASWSVTGTDSAEPQGPGAVWGLITTRSSLESTIRRPRFEFLAVKHWANHVISLKPVHWRPGPGSALKHSLSPLPSTPLFVPRLCVTAISSEGNRLLSPSPGLLSSELSRMHIWSCPALKSSSTDYPTGVTSPQRGELGQRLEA